MKHLELAAIAGITIVGCATATSSTTPGAAETSTAQRPPGEPPAALIKIATIAGETELVPDPVALVYRPKLRNGDYIDVEIPMLRSRRLPIRDNYHEPIAISIAWEQGGKLLMFAIAHITPPRFDGPLVQVATAAVPMPEERVTDRFVLSQLRHVYAAPDSKQPFTLWLLGSSRQYDRKRDLSPKAKLSVLRGFRIVPGQGVTEPTATIDPALLATVEEEGMRFYDNDNDRFTETQICALSLDPKAKEWFEKQRTADTMIDTYIPGTSYYDEAQAAANLRPPGQRELTASERAQADRRAGRAIANGDAVRKEGEREYNRQYDRLEKMARAHRPGCLAALLPANLASHVVLR